jgi:predicted nucleic acid-binding protein
MKIYLETQAKLYVQQQILSGHYDLVWSYILQYENMQNPHIAQKYEIAKWKNLAKYTIKASTEIVFRAKRYQLHGLHAKDALHCACAVEAKADFLITTDRQLISRANSMTEIHVINPLKFVEEVL